MGVVYTILMCVCFGIVKYYAEPNFPWHTYITLTIGYFACFGIMLTVPLDIATVVGYRLTDKSNYCINDNGEITSTCTLDLCDSPASSNSTCSYMTLPNCCTQGDEQYISDKNAIGNAYDFFFTIILLWGSVVLIFEEYYNTDGYFTVKQKLVSSLKRQMFDTFAPAIAAGIVFAILIATSVIQTDKIDVDALKLLAVILTNTCFETFLMFLLAYGLVEYPRYVWNLSNIDKELLRAQLSASSDFKAMTDAQLEISLEVSNVLKTKEALLSYADPILDHAISVLVDECPQEFRSSRMGTIAMNKDNMITLDTLAELRTVINWKKDAYRQSQAKLETTKLSNYFLEDLVEAKNKEGATTINWSLSGETSTEQEYKWHLQTRPLLMKSSAIALTILSSLSFLGVICSISGVDHTSSVYYQAVHGNGGQFGIALFILITFSYSIYVAIWALFKMQFAGMMVLVQGRTTPFCLSFNVRMVLRLAAPLSFFYLGWIAENGIIYDASDNGTVGEWLFNQNEDQPIYMQSAFSKFYSLGNVSEKFSLTFGTVFPVMFLILVFFFATNFFNKILVCLKLHAYQFGDMTVTDEQLREGKRQLARHKKATERTVQRSQLKNKILGNKADGLFTKLFSKSSNNNTNKMSLSNNINKAAEQEPNITPPVLLSGIIERKEGKKKMGISTDKWKDTYCDIRDCGELYFFKDKNSSNLKTNSTDIINLKLIVDFVLPVKKSSGFYLDLELSDRTVHLKFKDKDELEKWKTSLKDWKDFSIDFGDSYTNMLNKASNHDIESNDMVDRNSDDGGPLLGKIIKSDNPKAGLNSFQDIPLSNNKYNPSNTLSDKPPLLQGWLEKKGHGMVHMGNEWQRRYCRIDEETSTLQYYKTDKESDKPVGVIDLNMVISIEPYEKNGKIDHTRFNIDIGEKQYKFRVIGKDASTEGETWVAALEAWREYFLLNMA